MSNMMTALQPEASVAKRAAVFQQVDRVLARFQECRPSAFLIIFRWSESLLGHARPKGRVFAPGELPEPLVYVITPGFLRAMGIGLKGRDFTWADDPNSETRDHH